MGGVDDLSAQAELRTIGELGAGVDVDDGGVDFIEEAHGGRVVFRDDGVGVAGAVLVDVIHRFVQRVDDFDCGGVSPKLAAEIVGCSGYDVAADASALNRLERASVAVYLDIGLGPGAGDQGQVEPGNVGVHEERVEGVTDGVAARLGVMGDAHGLFDVSGGVHVGVADAGAAGEDGHLGVLGDVAYELNAAAGNDEVDHVLHLEELSDEATVGVLDELDGVGGCAGRFDGIANHGDEHLVRVDSLFAAAKEGPAAGFEAERCDINSDVGAALVDGRDDAEGHALAADLHAVGQRAHVDHLADRIGEDGDVTGVAGDRFEFLAVQLEPVDECVGESVLLRGGHIEGVGFDDVVSASEQAVGDSVEGAVLDFGGSARQHAGCSASCLALGLEFACCCSHPPGLRLCGAPVSVASGY